MKAILIDPINKTVQYVENEGGLDAIRKAIDTQYVERVTLGVRHEAIWIDEEGRINGKGEKVGGFNIGPFDIAGKGLILDCNEAGDEIATGLTVEQVAPKINWLEPEWFERNPCPPMQFIPL